MTDVNIYLISNTNIVTTFTGIERYPLTALDFKLLGISKQEFINTFDKTGMFLELSPGLPHPGGEYRVVEYMHKQWTQLHKSSYNAKISHLQALAPYLLSSPTPTPQNALRANLKNKLKSLLTSAKTFVSSLPIFNRGDS
jgi:hypothetical protein